MAAPTSRNAAHTGAHNQHALVTPPVRPSPFSPLSLPPFAQRPSQPLSDGHRATAAAAAQRSAAPVETALDSEAPGTLREGAGRGQGRTHAYRSAPPSLPSVCVSCVALCPVCACACRQPVRPLLRCALLELWLWLRWPTRGLLVRTTANAQYTDGHARLRGRSRRGRRCAG
jgi:hypothetical protein